MKNTFDMYYFFCKTLMLLTFLFSGTANVQPSSSAAVKNECKLSFIASITPFVV
jgi:hypothetical protein